MNAIEPGSPLPIHRHRKSSEMVVILRGRLVEEFYDELERRCTESIELRPGGPVMAMNIPIGQWHILKTKCFEPIHLRKYGGMYFVDDGGNHRVCQARFFGLETVPCEVTEYVKID